MATEPAYDKRLLAGELAEVFLAKDSKVRLIDFYIGPGERLHVMGAQLSKMGDLILKEKIRIAVDDAYLAAENAAAIYNGRNASKEKNRFVIPSTWVRTEEAHKKDLELTRKLVLDPSDVKPSVYKVFVATPQHKATLVHEATHALLDYRGINVYYVRNEVAAFLAGVIYLYHIGAISLLTGLFRPHLWGAAHVVANREKLYLKTGVRLNRSDLQPLLNNVHKSYGMAWGTRTGPDGID